MVAENNIQLSPEQIDASLAQLVESFDGMVESCGTLQTNSATVADAWEGNAGQSCKELLELLASGFANVANKLGEFDEDLNFANLSYVQIDETRAAAHEEVGSCTTTVR